MTATDSHEAELKPAGYAALIARLGISVLPNWHESFIASGNKHRIEATDGTVREVYPSKYWPGDGLGDQLEFALKYDGVNLAILASIFRAADTAEITAYIASKPTGKYARRIWYLYEWITGQRLPLDDLKRGNYVDLLDPKRYCTARLARETLLISTVEDGKATKETRHPLKPTWQVRRHRINDNLLGDARFCPTIRRTETIHRFMNAGLRERC